MTNFERKAALIPQKYTQRLNQTDMQSLQKEIADLCEYFYNLGKGDAVKDPALRKMIADEAVLSDD